MAEAAFPLHPRSAGDILDHAVRLYRRNFLSLLKLIVVPFPLVLTLSFLLDSISRSESWAQDWRSAIFWGLVLVAYAWVTSVISGAVARWVSEANFHTSVRIWTYYGRVLRRSMSLAWGDTLLFLLLFVGILLPIGGVMGVVLAVWSSWSAITVGLGAVTILILPAIALGTTVLLSRLFLFIVIVALEDLAWPAAFRRSWRLVRGNFWRAFAVLLFSTALAFGPILLVNYANEFFEGLIGPVAGLLFSEITGLLLSPIWSIAETLLYFDCRVRREGFDLETMAKSLAASSQRP